MTCANGGIQAEITGTGVSLAHNRAGASKLKHASAWYNVMRFSGLRYRNADLKALKPI